MISSIISFADCQRHAKLGKCLCYCNFVLGPYNGLFWPDINFLKRLQTLYYYDHNQRKLNVYTLEDSQSIIKLYRCYDTKLDQLKNTLKRIKKNFFLNLGIILSPHQLSASNLHWIEPNIHRQFSKFLYSLQNNFFNNREV